MKRKSLRVGSTVDALAKFFPRALAAWPPVSGLSLREEGQNLWISRARERIVERAAMKFPPEFRVAPGMNTARRDVKGCGPSLVSAVFGAFRPYCP
jgi:hypothetical protein